MLHRSCKVNVDDLRFLMAAAECHFGRILKPYDALYEAGGFAALVALSDAVGGRNVYVPGLRSMLAGCIEMEAKRACLSGGMSVAEAARCYGYTPGHLRKLLAK